MRISHLALAAWLLPVAGCVAHVHQENAALLMVWPAEPAELATDPRGPGAFPSATGDTMKGTSPADLAAARDAEGAALNEALAKP